VDKAIKHYMIAASFGYIFSLENIKLFMNEGRATENDYQRALRSYQQYVEEVRTSLALLARCNGRESQNDISKCRDNQCLFHEQTYPSD
jgi:hypothetical protein